ncbi:MAG: N-acetyl-gamma-glutamyl-phosphate reductase [Elusimicrobia bacterium RIFCSPLOWO2_01_FULL_60_11]|nr:MAG: N-acetyl-gamma-glutamyl-phosphate reductase [Elusimicrobia bacterium RIFCSPLOWO2_01_FULL_60_11]
MKNVSVIGATGYTGGELLRYLLRHPGVRVSHATSERSAGQKVSVLHTDLAGRLDLTLVKNDPDKISKDSGLVFLCLPHAESAAWAKKYLDRGVKVIDLSADLRLASVKSYEKWYKTTHPHPELLKKAVYGLPELYRAKIKGAKLVANPGCYSTTSILTALPLVKKGWARKGSIVIDAKSGVSGAGRKIESRYLFCEAHENFLAYAVTGHRHLPEIEQELGQSVTFVPHLLPVNRGILATVYAKLSKKISAKELHAAYAEFYKGEAFVKVLDEGKFPELKSVQHTNYCHIGVGLDPKGDTAVLVGVTDNLGKGAAGQALQNMNLVLGFKEGTGLE